MRSVAMTMEGEAIIVVSGVPRSGTSMMMQALAAGGMPVLADHERVADEDNPRGYFEFAPAKTIGQDKSWLPQAQGRAVKLVSALLRHLPQVYEYKIVFMQRDMAEVLASQQAMLHRRGAKAGGNDVSLAHAFERHRAGIAAWIATQANMDAVYVNYHDVLSDPTTQLNRVRTFVQRHLTLDAMVSVVDQRLHRQRFGQ